MKTIRFDCHGHNAPAYGCSEPGDNSGEYVRAKDYQALAQTLDIIAFHLRRGDHTGPGGERCTSGILDRIRKVTE